VLRNRAVIDNGVQFIGIDDMDDAMQVSRQLARINVESEPYVILLYHRPRGLEAAAEAGVDLMLSGHTHNGQIVPFNLIVKRVFEQMRGLYYYAQATLYVSSGTGTWGPIMRLGTRSEITLIEVLPA
jgi:predicted MPP superfamily phosphohydrolase